MHTAPTFIVKSDNNPTCCIVAGGEFSIGGNILFKVDRINNEKWAVILIAGSRAQLREAIGMSGLIIEEKIIIS